MNPSQTLHIAEQDNVMVALRMIAGGTVVDGVTVASDVPAGHKIATRADPRPGEIVLKYGYPIGVATRDIAPGEHVHSHNLTSTLRDDFDPSKHAAHQRPLRRRAREAATFDGFRRADGRVGMRNEIWIVNTVGCVNNAAERIAAAARKELESGADWGSVDGVHAFPHQFGCSQLGDDLELTQKILAGLVRHPNAGGVLILGLGCENNQMKLMLEQRRHDRRPSASQYFNAQDVGDEVEEGIARIRQLAAFAGKAKREPIPAKELILGMKCGGSDGLSGITANPLVGKIANRIAGGGRHRAADRGAGDVRRRGGAAGPRDQRRRREERHRHGQQLPRLLPQVQPADRREPGARQQGGRHHDAGGEVAGLRAEGRRRARGAGARRTASTAPVGLGGIGLINAPGNDGVSSTAMVAAGAHILLFTTGRGTPLGFPSPTIKISTNSDLAVKKPSWIDFDAGPIALGTSTFEELGPKLYSAGARRRQRPHADQERAQRLPRDRDLEGRRHALSVAPGGSSRVARKLDAQLLASGHKFPQELAVAPPRALPEKVLQFGEGNFLRAFVDWMFARLNRARLVRGPRGAGAADRGRDGEADQRAGRPLHADPARPVGRAHRRAARDRVGRQPLHRPVPGLRRVHRLRGEPGPALRRLEHDRGGDQDRSGRRARRAPVRRRSRAS